MNNLKDFIRGMSIGFIFLALADGLIQRNYQSSSATAIMAIYFLLVSKK